MQSRRRMLGVGKVQNVSKENSEIDFHEVRVERYISACILLTQKEAPVKEDSNRE